MRCMYGKFGGLSRGGADHVANILNVSSLVAEMQK